MFNSFGQFSLKLYVVDAIGRIDSVQFGVNWDSTVEVDTALNETDIYGTNWNPLDIRIIHRDSIQHNCLLEFNWYNYPLSPELYFDKNMDFKIEYRPSNQFYSIYNCFEILIKSDNPPVTIIQDFSEIANNMFEGWSTLHLLNNDCSTFETKSIIAFPESDTIYTSSENFTTLIADFQFQVSVDELISNPIKIYPNPSKDKLIIEAENLQKVEIMNVSGQLLYLENNSNIIDIQNFQNGIYFCKIITERVSFIEKFVVRK